MFSSILARHGRSQKTADKEIGDGITQPYAAPERMAGHAAEDFRSDAFSLSVVAYELLTLAIPFGGLGGRAGTPRLAVKTAKSYKNPSELIAADRLPRRTVKLLDDCLARGLAVHPDDRFSTSRDWLAAWDELHFTMKKGTRLNRLESLVVDSIDALCRLLRRDSAE